MLFEKSFSTSDGTRFGLMFDLDDDSRKIVDLDGKCRLKFDSSLYVFDAEDKQIGYLHSQNGYFVFTSQRADIPSVNTSWPSDNWHYELLKHAEMSIAQDLYDFGVM